MVSPRRTTNAAPSVAGITTCFPSGIVRPSLGDFLLMVLLFSFCRYREDRGGSIQTRRLEQSARLTGHHPRLVGSNRALHFLEHRRLRRFVPCPLDHDAAEHAEPKHTDPEQYSDAALVHRHLPLSLGR